MTSSHIMIDCFKLARKETLTDEWSIRSKIAKVDEDDESSENIWCKVIHKSWTPVFGNGKSFFSFCYQDNSISRLSCFYENTEKWKLLLREKKIYETGEGIVFVQWKAIHTKWIKYYRRNEVHWRAAIQASGNGTLEPTINSMIDTRPGIWRWFLW